MSDLSSSNSCMCPCHTGTAIDYRYCMMCAGNHNNYFTIPPEPKGPVNYNAITFAVLQEIRDVLKDIKSILVEMNDESKRRQRSEPRRSSRSDS